MIKLKNILNENKSVVNENLSDKIKGLSDGESIHYLQQLTF
jgi:thermostable 8-oxoguanine DNA glycosylase